MAKRKTRAAAPVAPPTEEQRRAAWLAQRRTLITSTDVAAILGVHPTLTPMDVWLDKRGERESEPNERMEWGNRLQEAILMGYADRTHQRIALADPYKIETSTEIPILGATLDAWVQSDEPRAGTPVDAKNVGWKRPGVWGEEGSDEVPEPYLIQLTVQMMVLGATEADLAVLFGGNRLERFTVRLDPSLRDAIRDTVIPWWTRHVKGGIAPPVDGGKAWSQHLARRAQTSEIVARAGPTEEEAARKLAALRALLAEAEEQAAQHENLIKAAIGECAGMAGTGWHATYKATKGATKIDWHGVAIELSIWIQSLIEENGRLTKTVRARKIAAAKRHVEALIAARTTTGAGSRRFLFKREGEEDG